MTCVYKKHFVIFMYSLTTASYILIYKESIKLPLKNSYFYCLTSSTFQHKIKMSILSVILVFFKNYQWSQALFAQDKKKMKSKATFIAWTHHFRFILLILSLNFVLLPHFLAYLFLYNLRRNIFGTNFCVIFISIKHLSASVKDFYFKFMSIKQLLYFTQFIYYLWHFLWTVTTIVLFLFYGYRIAVTFCKILLIRKNKKYKYKKKTCQKIT